MVNLASLFLPSLSGNTVMGGIFVIIGLALIILSIIYLPAFFKNAGVFIGFVILVLGLFIFIVGNFLQNIFNNPLIGTSIVVGLVLILLYYFLFIKKERGRRK